MNTQPIRPSRELTCHWSSPITVILLLFVGGVWQVVILSLLLAYILDPVATCLEARGMSRTFAVVLIVLVVTGLLALIGFVLVPSVIHQMQGMQSGTTTDQAAAAIKGMEQAIESQLQLSRAGRPGPARPD